MKFKGRPSLAARSVNKRPTSISQSAGGTPSTPARSSRGISSNRSSIDRTPITSSMRAISSGVWGMNAMKGSLLGFVGQVIRIVRGAHQRGVVDRRSRLHAEHPPRPIRILIEQFGLRRQRAVAGDDFPAHRTVDIGGRLDGFDDRARLAGVYNAAHFRNLDEHQIAERTLRVFGNADLDGAVLRGAHPFVALGIAQITRYVAQCISLLG